MEIADPVSVTPIPPTIPQKQQHHPRRVRFQDKSSETTSNASLSQSYEVKDCPLWYTDDEIAGFRTDARLLCRELRANSNNCWQEPAAEKKEGGSLRGLEFRTSLARQERKQMTIRCIIKAQHRATSPQQLARVYRKCSKWTMIASLTVAQNDYCTAYNLGTFLPLPSMLDYPLPFPTKYGAYKRRVNHQSTSAKKLASNPNNSCIIIGHAHSEAHRQLQSRVGVGGA